MSWKNFKPFLMSSVLLVLAASNTQGCSGPTPSTNFDPHSYNLCVQGTQVEVACADQTLYLTTNEAYGPDTAYAYSGYNKDKDGCVPCDLFPWMASSNPQASRDPILCIGAALNHGVPHCDPSYYWQCNRAYAPPDLRKCPPGTGFSNGPWYLGCVPWYVFNW